MSGETSRSCTASLSQRLQISRRGAGLARQTRRRRRRYKYSQRARSWDCPITLAGSCKVSLEEEGRPPRHNDRGADSPTDPTDPRSAPTMSRLAEEHLKRWFSARGHTLDVK